jgi:hypothetical protein
MTNAAAKNAFGAELWVSAVGQTLALIAECNVITPTVLSRGTNDTTTFDSVGGAGELFPQGIYQVSPVEIEGLCVTNSAIDTLMTGWLVNATALQFKVVTKGATAKQKEAGLAFLTTYGQNQYTKEGLQTFKAVFSVTGATTKAVDS